MSDVALMVIAKNPVPGRSKTRLCPPCSPAQAAALAEAALRDTLAVVARTPAGRRVLVLDGDAARWQHPQLEIIPQRGDGLDERLAGAFEDVAGPALLIGMDTPQVTPALLLEGIAGLGRADAVIGPACDGGYWSVGLREARRQVFKGVPMSSPETLHHQRTRLAELGLSVHEQPALRDVDTIEDARAVAAAAPESSFAAMLAAIL